MKTIISLCFVLSALAFAGDKTVSKKAEPAPFQTYSVTYRGGPQWKANEPMEKQDLAGHMGYVQKLVEKGTLLANGHLADGRGFYVFAASNHADADVIVAADPGIQTGVLQVDAVAPWLLVMENLAAGAKTDALFVLNYRPGPKWKAGKPLLEQDVTQHLAYVGKAFGKGQLLAGGPVDAHQGRYVISAADMAAALAWVAADPAVKADTFRVEVVAWQTFNRQSAKR
jgi:uncharacterized protein YciI